MASAARLWTQCGSRSKAEGQNAHRAARAGLDKATTRIQDVLKDGIAYEGVGMAAVVVGLFGVTMMLTMLARNAGY